MVVCTFDGNSAFPQPGVKIYMNSNIILVPFGGSLDKKYTNMGFQEVYRISHNSDVWYNIVEITESYDS